jgi:hypothetical protein
MRNAKCANNRAHTPERSKRHFGHLCDFAVKHCGMIHQTNMVPIAAEYSNWSHSTVVLIKMKKNNQISHAKHETKILLQRTLISIR